MENTRPQPCGQADVQDAFHLEAVRDDAGRKALFARMCREGLTGCAMYAWPHPREDDWLHLVSAPGRTEIAGNHTDHNNGKVLAAAINLDCVACVAPKEDMIARVHSQGFPAVTLDLSQLEPQ